MSFLSCFAIIKPSIGRRDHFVNILPTIKQNIQKVLVGQEETITLLLTGLLAGGHVLIEDVPGMGKTVLAGPWPSP